MEQSRLESFVRGCTTPYLLAWAVATSAVVGGGTFIVRAAVDHEKQSVAFRDWQAKDPLGSCERAAAQCGLTREDLQRVNPYAMILEKQDRARDAAASTKSPADLARDKRLAEITGRSLDPPARKQLTPAEECVMRHLPANGDECGERIAPSVAGIINEGIASGWGTGQAAVLLAALGLLTAIAKVYYAEPSQGWRRLAVIAAAAGLALSVWHVYSESPGDYEGLAYLVMGPVAGLLAPLLVLRLVGWVRAGFSGPAGARGPDSAQVSPPRRLTARLTVKLLAGVLAVFAALLALLYSPMALLEKAIGAVVSSVAIILLVGAGRFFSRRS